MTIKVNQCRGRDWRGYEVKALRNNF